MDKDEFLEIIFKMLSDAIKTTPVIKITGVHCSGVYVSILDNKENLPSYNISISAQK